VASLAFDEGLDQICPRDLNFYPVLFGKSLDNECVCQPRTIVMIMQNIMKNTIIVA